MRSLALLMTGIFCAASATAAPLSRTVYSDGNGCNLIRTEIGEQGPATNDTPIYENMTLGDNYTVSGSDPLTYFGQDDYSSTISTGDIILSSFQFIGGVANANEILYFDFFDTDENPVDGFGIELPDPGNWVWTITFDTGVLVEPEGILKVAPGPDTTGTWYLNAESPTVGTTTTFPGYTDPLGTPVNAKFALLIPEPASLALLLPSLLVLRRR